MLLPFTHTCLDQIIHSKAENNQGNNQYSGKQ